MLGGAASHPSEERRRRMWQDVLIRTRGVKQRRGEENLLLEKSFYFRGKSKGKSYKLLHPKLFFTVTPQNFLHDGLRPKHFSDLLPRYEPPNLSGLLGRVCLPSTGPKQNTALQRSAFKHHTGPFWISLVLLLYLFLTSVMSLCKSLRIASFFFFFLLRDAMQIKLALPGATINVSKLWSAQPKKKWTLPTQIVLFELFMEAWRGEIVWQ